jgi:hypothetical protein
MATTEITLDASLSGTVVARDGYITTLRVLTPPRPSWQTENYVAWPRPHGRFSNGSHFSLREGLTGKRLINVDTVSDRSPELAGWSISFKELVLESCPIGSTYTLIISDVPVKRARAA